MLGVVGGDIVGSLYKFNHMNDFHFYFFGEECTFSDNGADWVELLHKYDRRYQDLSHDLHVGQWTEHRTREPYGSCGNGSAMRVGPVGYAFEDLKVVQERVMQSAEATRNHPAEAHDGSVPGHIADWSDKRLPDIWEEFQRMYPVDRG